MTRRRLTMPSTRSAEEASADEVTDLEVATSESSTTPRPGVVATLTGADLTTPVTLDQVPAPYEARRTGELDGSEAEDLAVCERALAGLQQAFTVAGKALATINSARLYRQTHATFADYVEDRWGIKRAHAYRWIEGWPVAAALSPRGDIPEKHVRALLPVVKRHGLPAARATYEALREQDARVTTARITNAVRALPPRLASPEQAGDVVRVAAAEGRLPQQTAPAGPPEQQEPADLKADEHDQAHDVVTEGARAVAVLGAALEAQQRLYDGIAGVGPVALAHDPTRADHLLREIRQYALRTAHRARPARRGEGEETGPP